MIRTQGAYGIAGPAAKRTLFDGHAATAVDQHPNGFTGAQGALGARAAPMYSSSAVGRCQSVDVMLNDPTRLAL